MGLISDTTVVTKNETTVNTAVDIGIENTVDLSGIERFLNFLGDLFTQQHETANSLQEEQTAALMLQNTAVAGQAGALADANTISRQNLAVALLNTVAEGEKTAQLVEANKTFKQLSYGALALAAAWMIFKG